MIRALTVVFVLLGVCSALGRVLYWEHNYTDDVGNPLPVTFNVYIANGQQWQQIGSTTNRYFSITNRGVYAVSAQDGTNITDRAMCAWHPQIMRVSKMTIGR